MSEKYTQGRLVVGELNGHGIEIKHTHGDVPGAISLVLARVTARPTWIAEAEANARRLAACWNACDGIGTERLEAHAMHSRRQLDALADARALLAEAAGVVDGIPNAYGIVLADRIRAFLKGRP